MSGVSSSAFKLQRVLIASYPHSVQCMPGEFIRALGVSGPLAQYSMFQHDLIDSNPIAGDLYK